MSTPAERSAFEPHPSSPGRQEWDQRALAYLRGIDGWLLALAILSQFLASAIENYFSFRRVFPYSGPLYVVSQSAMVFSLLCGYLFGFRLLCHLRLWWLRIFPILTLTSFCLWLLLSFLLSLWSETPVGDVIQTTLEPLPVVLAVCAALSTPTLVIVMLRSIVSEL